MMAQKKTDQKFKTQCIDSIILFSLTNFHMTDAEKKDIAASQETENASTDESTKETKTTSDEKVPGVGDLLKDIWGKAKVLAWKWLVQLWKIGEKRDTSDPKNT